MKQMEKMMKDPDMMSMGSQKMSNEMQMEMMLKMLVEQSRALDELFQQTGIEEEQLLYSIDKLQLEQDQDFQIIA